MRREGIAETRRGEPSGDGVRKRLREFVALVLGGGAGLCDTSRDGCCEALVGGWGKGCGTKDERENTPYQAF